MATPPPPTTTSKRAVLPSTLLVAGLLIAACEAPAPSEPAAAPIAAPPAAPPPVTHTEPAPPRPLTVELPDLKPLLPTDLLDACGPPCFADEAAIHAHIAELEMLRSEGIEAAALRHVILKNPVDAPCTDCHWQLIHFVYD